MGLRLEDPGVWDQHVEITCDREQGVTARVQAPALARLDGEAFEATVLRSGDILEIGGVRVQFWLAPAEVVTPWLREGLTWVGIGMVAALEIGLAYWIAR